MKKQENIKKKSSNLKYLIILLETFIFLCYHPGCISSENNNIVCIEKLSSLFIFDKYYFFTAKKDNEVIYLITERTNSLIIDSSKYEQIEFENTYCLPLIKIDTLVSADIDRFHGDAIILDDTEIWSCGKFRVQLYKSDYIKGEYIWKESKK